MAIRFASDHPLRVSPAVLGRPLASPTRRALALLLDGLLLLIPANAVVAGTAALALRVGDPAAYRALRALVSDSAAPEALHDARTETARLLTRIDAPGLPPAVACAVREGRFDDAATGLAGSRIDLDLRLDGQEPPHRAGHIHVPVHWLIPAPIRALVVFSVPALYFTLLTSLRGETLGKRVLGLRVVRLDAERLSLLESFERFIGYLHVPSLLGWPILDLWRNPNRQLPHDRTVHTIVVRRQRQSARPADERTHPQATQAPARELPTPEQEPKPPSDPEH